ncbi:MAG: pantoate--beta-alanine ligase [Planctomycetales bacterium]|nr:pantoate--beta-alanine ligase [Planctomycetales bacterium]
MQIIHTTKQAREFVWNLRRNDSTVGLVPTMGALHDGHLSLVQASGRRCDHTVATIFVNPTQFAPGEDLQKYPRTLDADIAGLRSAGADAVFIPDQDQIYPPGCSTFVKPPDVAETLEGEFRPTHFQGVCTIVLKLFHLLPTTHAFFGEKDFQQLCVIQAMVRDLDVDIEIVPCPIVRDPDGLAMSSRNRYLNDRQRQRALCLSAALRQAEQAYLGGEQNPKTIENQMRSILSGDDQNNGVDSIDYAAVVDSKTLQPISDLDQPAVALIAARVGSTRLIDNRVLCAR